MTIWYSNNKKLKNKILNINNKKDLFIKRRVGSEVRNYHYTALDPKIEGPFTLGLVLPASYGNNWIKAGDEINKSIEKGKYYILRMFEKYIYS